MEEKIKQQLQLASSMENEFREEEFYEEIEAPKFVDFSLPDHFSPDDRYWFCSRVGCDQRHEEEMDSEAIYKNFVLRVMAARSPNVRLRKALCRRTSGETKKCPLSAPPKPSKSRLPRLAVASSISKKLNLGIKGAKNPPPEKPSLTPKARVKHVAAKYMTSVRKKKVSSPNAKGFRSVRNPKRTSITLHKNKVVTKALVFNSPKKSQKVKKVSVELATPITKLCEGMKKMKISQKPSKECRSVRKALSSDVLKKQPSSCRKNDPKLSANFKSKSSKKEEKKGEGALKGAKSAKTRDDSSDMEFEGKSRAGSVEHSGMSKSKVEKEANSRNSSSCSGSSSSQKVIRSENTLTSEIAALTDSEDTVSAQENLVPNDSSIGSDQSEAKQDNAAAAVDNDDVDNQNPRVLGEVIDNQGKENGLNSDDIGNMDVGNLSKHNAPSVKHKIKTVDKTLKENCSAGMQGAKYKKLKPTNPKPFRLRTDERGILKESTLEKRNDSNEDATMTSENLQSSGTELSENREKGGKKELDKGFKQNQLRTIKSKYMSTTKAAEPKSDRGLAPCSEKSSKMTKPKRETASQPKSRLHEAKATVVKPKEPRKASKMVGNPTSKAPVVTRKLAAPGRRAATIPREPNFQSLHKPKSCIKNTA